MFDVARFPSRIPVIATSALPVQTVRRYRSRGKATVTKSMAGWIRGRCRVPNPPGTIRTSISSGASAKVCVGTTLWDMGNPSAPGFVGTGSRVAARMYSSSSGTSLDSRFRMSRGPKTSSAWKPGKSTTPNFLGGVVVAWDVIVKYKR